MKHSITYRLDNKANILGEVLILLVLTFAGIRILLSSGVHIRPDDWDSEAMRPVKTAKNAAGQTATSIIADISAKAEQLDRIFLLLEQDNSLSPERIKALYRESQEKTTALALDVQKVLPSLQDFIREETSIHEWTPATQEKFHALGNHIHAVSPNMTFDELDEKGLTRLLEHFRSVLLHDGSIGMRNSTIRKQYEYLRWFLNWATKKGLNHNLAYQTFSPSLKQTQKKVIYLTPEEIERLAQVDVTAPNRRHLERIIDIFLFQCFSGLRYSDVDNLRWSNINNSAITITTIKTNDTITIELNRHTRALLDKYRPYQFLGDKVFPTPSNQEMNRYIKEACRLAGIDEPISVVYYKGKERIEEIKPKYELVGTHAGRRTFVVRALSLGISPYVVMRWTGHSSFNAMKPYMDIVDSAKAEAMDKFNI